MSDPKDNSDLPRILCLHGGGVNAEVFELQMRAVIAALKHHFRFVFANGPFLCDAGPGIVPVYKDYGPFRRWFRWMPEHEDIDDESAIEEIRYSLRTAMEGDKVGTGPFVAILGFSQGAKLAASLLFEQQLQSLQSHESEKLGKGSKFETNFRFGVLLAGRAPIISLSERSANMGLGSAGEVPGDKEFKELDEKDRLKIPTIHVHGLKDPGLELHRKLLKGYCDQSHTSLVEWDGEHRVPVQTVDVAAVTSRIISIGKLTGIMN